MHRDDCALAGTVGNLSTRSTDQSVLTSADLSFGAERSRARSIPAVIAFFVLAFVWTWGLWAITSFTERLAPGMSTALFLASAFGPSVAAIVVTLVFGGGRNLRDWLGQCLNWRIGWRWYALVLIAPPIVMIVALIVHSAFGGIIPPSPVAGHVLIAIAQVPLISLFGGPLGEEFGWRGYALPVLSARIGWRQASLVIGVVWGLWHVPLFYMANTAQADLPMALFLASTVALSVAFARLSVNTGFSVVPALLLHSAINWWSMVLPVMPKGGSTQIYSLVLAFVIAIGLAALLLPEPKRKLA